MFLRKELQEAIENEFIFMVRKNTYSKQKEEGRIYDLYGADGCAVGDGWYNVIKEMCREITQAYVEEGKEIDLIPLQVKSKFARLRVYYCFDGDKPGICAMDFIGGDELTTVRFTPNETTFRKKITNIIRKYEERSASVCEKCGGEGRVRTDLPWILTLCDNCYKEKIENRTK